MIITVNDLHDAFKQLARSERGRNILTVLQQEQEAFVSLDAANQAATVCVVTYLVHQWPATREKLNSKFWTHDEIPPHD